MAIKPFQSPDIEAMFKQINPNQVAPGNAAGIGSGNPIRTTAPSFTINQGTMSPLFDPDQAGGVTDPGTSTVPTDPDTNGGGGYGGEPDAGTSEQNPLDLLRDFFPDASDERLQELVKFVSVIPSELYEAADPEAEMYSLMRQERTGMLEAQRDTAENRARRSLFTTLEQARGMEGKRGFALGRNIYGDVSEAAASGFESVQDQFSRGLFNINQSIIDRTSAAQRYLAGLESQQRGDMLKLADLADLFKDQDDDNGFTGSTDQDDYEG